MSSDDKDDLTQDAGALDAGTDSETWIDPDRESDIDLEQPTDSTESITFRRRRPGLVASIALFILLLLFGGGAFFWYQASYLPTLADLREQISTIGGAQGALSAEVSRSLSAVDAAAADAQAVGDDVAALNSKIDGAVTMTAGLKRSVSELYEKESQTSVDWVLAEAEYLVLAATQRLALEHDTGTAVAALRAADQRLRSVGHPDLLPIRDQLIKDITALEAVNTPDIEGLAIYLAKTVDQVDGLPTKPIAEEITPFGTVREGEYKAEDWRRLAYAIWSDLVDLVEVKDAALPDSVLFDPELRYFLQQNLKLELASARLAVLRRDRANLDASVGLIKRQLDAYYDGDDAAVKSILERLDEAAGLELNPVLPNISGSLEVIRKQRANESATTEAAQ